MISIKPEGPITVVCRARIKYLLIFILLMLYCLYFSKSNPYFLIFFSFLTLIFVYSFFFTSRFEAFIIDEGSRILTLQLRNSKSPPLKILLKDVEMRVKVWFWNSKYPDPLVARYPMAFTFYSKKESSMVVPAKFSYLEGIKILDFFSKQEGVTLNPASRYLLRNSLSFLKIFISYTIHQWPFFIFVGVLVLLAYFSPGMAKFFLLDNPEVGIIIFLSYILVGIFFIFFKKNPLEIIYSEAQKIEKKEYESEEKNRYFTGSWK